MTLLYKKDAASLVPQAQHDGFESARMGVDASNDDGALFLPVKKDDTAVFR